MKKTEFRFLHTMLRVFDIEKSVDFYTKHLGMKLLRRKDFEAGRFTLAFLGYGKEDKNTVIELTHNWDQSEPYQHGDGFGHIAIAVPDVFATCEILSREGVNIPRPAGPMKGGTRNLAFIEDPDGYQIELIER